MELYTYDYAHDYSKNKSEAIKSYIEVSSYLKNRLPQLELNAGHDLNLENLVNSVRGHYDIPNLPFLTLGVGSKKVQKAMVEVSKKLTNVSYIERSQDVNKSNYTPIYTHKWKDKPVGHYNYEGMKKIGQLFFESYQASYANLLQ